MKKIFPHLEKYVLPIIINKMYTVIVASIGTWGFVMTPFISHSWLAIILYTISFVSFLWICYFAYLTQKKLDAVTKRLKFHVFYKKSFGVLWDKSFYPYCPKHNKRLIVRHPESGEGHCGSCQSRWPFINDETCPINFRDARAHLKQKTSP